MKGICHVELGGINEMPRVWREADAASSAGIRTFVVGFGSAAERGGIPYIGFPREPSRFKRFFVLSRKMMAAAADTQAELIQIHSPIFLLYARKLKRAGRKIVFDSHEDYPLQILRKPYIPAFFRPMISRVYRAYEKACCKWLDGVLIPCTTNAVNRFDGSAKRSLILGNFSRAVHVSQAPETREKQAVYAGSLTYDRGISHLARAIMKTDGKLVLCGAFGSEALRDEISSYPPEKVEYKGLVDRNMLIQIYLSSTVGMSTLLHVGQHPVVDTLSTKAYEYMQCGLPVITTDFRYAKAQNEKYHFGICVDPENTDEIAGAIQYLFDHPSEVKRMGENGRKAIREAFNWENEEKKLLAFYEEIFSKQ